MTATGGTSTSGSSLHDQIRASSELAAEMRRFGQVCSYGLALWLSFGAMGIYLAVTVYAAPVGLIVITRAIGTGLLLTGMVLGRTGTPRSILGTTLATAALTFGISFLIGYEGAYLGGASSPYAVGASFALVGLATMQRNAREAWPAFAVCSLGYIVGALASPALSLSSLTRVEVSELVVQSLLLVGLSVFCLLLSHYAWTVRRQLFESRSIGRYRLQRRLGRGGMGEVWAAFHTTLGRDVAVKILRPEKIDDASVQRFEREVRATTALTHPNTVRVFDYGMTEDGLWYYAMELLDGISFAQLVASFGPQPQGRVVHLVAQAARALGEAHRAGIVHRDVKPDNLLISQAGGEPDFVKVIDFGIARTLGDAEVTVAGQVAGTPSYMAPEVAGGTVFDARSDVYSLGGVLYFLLTGAPPFVAADPASVMLAHRIEPVVPPSLRAPGPIDSDLEELVLTCLAKDPQRRFLDGAAMADALARTAAFTAWRPGSTEQIAPLANVDPSEPTIADR